MTVTLETLRADFENHPLFDENDPIEIRWIVLKDLWTAGYRFDRASPGFAGAIYIVARDHGLEAAMIYKLSDGNIDPRVNCEEKDRG